jgi:hypothetical protein
MSPVATAAYRILRSRLSLTDPRITYAQLAEQLRDASEEFESVYHRSWAFMAMLEEVGRECLRLGLPPLPALVVRSDTRRPGTAYHGGRRSRAISGDARITAWQNDLEAVKRATYPP